MTGSETTLNGKTEAAATLKIAANIIQKQTWKSMSKAAPNSVEGLIFAIRGFLKKFGVNVTKRKASQIIPIAGAVTGGILNASWGADALEAVRQYARLSIVEYYTKNKPNATATTCA